MFFFKKKKREEGEKGEDKDSNNNTKGGKSKVKNLSIICFRCKKKGHPAFMCPNKDKDKGMYTFNFNVGEIIPKQKLIPNKKWKTWQWANWVNEECNISDTKKIGISIDNDSENEEMALNAFGALYQSDSDDGNESVSDESS
jgi:hypothetical protein